MSEHEVKVSRNQAANREIERIRGQALWDEYCILRENWTSHDTRQRLDYLEKALTEIQEDLSIYIDTMGDEKDHVRRHKNELRTYEQSPEVRKALDGYHQRRAQKQLEAKVLYGGDCFLEDEHGNSIAAPDGCPEEER